VTRRRWGELEGGAGGKKQRPPRPGARGGGTPAAVHHPARPRGFIGLLPDDSSNIGRRAGRPHSQPTVVDRRPPPFAGFALAALIEARPRPRIAPPPIMDHPGLARTRANGIDPDQS